MYPNSSYYYQWYNPMQCHWNSKSGYDWNPHYYNRNNYYHNPYGNIPLHDYGTRPFVVNIDQATKQNNNYRTALWTGKYFQVTLMSINVGEDIGLEVHPTTDQFIRIEEGQALVQMGDSRESLDFQVMAYDDYAIMIPAGKWHNVINTGNSPLKVYVIYAPPEHPYGTVHETKAIAQGTR
ncbi:cupin domain-containing protein [Brevibacillus panacihumi]|uniref:cupin domain-containing protein n=1 Tax=Brevibacillus panacihumi TaxID=497735 RepID=UPI003D020C32